MPGKVLKPVLADSHCKCDISATDIDAISALKATREHNLDLDSAMKSEKWKRKKEGTKGVSKAPRNRLQRPHIAKYQDVQVDDDGEDIIETDWVADGGSADWPVVHEVPLVDLLKPGKPRSRDPPARDFEVIPGASSVIALDDQLIPEPEAVEDDWERLELDDDPDADSAHHAPSYAEVAANR